MLLIIPNLIFEAAVPAGTMARHSVALRVEHLRELRAPTLMVQGERDAFGSKCEVASYELSPSIQVHWPPDGNHNFTPRKASGRTEVQNWEAGRAVVERFTRALAIRR